MGEARCRPRNVAWAWTYDTSHQLTLNIDTGYRPRRVMGVGGFPLMPQSPKQHSATN
jgi:hypothetical protein